jgi:ribosome-associated toxin RatA of RatAB toxin-antitoxin module
MPNRRLIICAILGTCLSIQTGLSRTWAEEGQEKVSNEVPSPKGDAKVKTESVRKPGFKVIHQRNGIRVGARPVKDSDYPEYLIQAIVETDIDRLWEVISDVESYPEFMPYVVKTQIVKEEADSIYVYQRVDPPIGSDRDFTMKVRIEKKDGLYVRRFDSCTEECPAKLEKVIRVSCCTGSWTFKKLDDKRSLIKYQLHTNPGGSMPAWLTRKANKTSLPGVVDAVRKRALDKTWGKVAKVAKEE